MYNLKHNEADIEHSQWSCRVCKCNDQSKHTYLERPYDIGRSLSNFGSNKEIVSGVNQSLGRHWANAVNRPTAWL